jgi:hypothetical protein
MKFTLGCIRDLIWNREPSFFFENDNQHNDLLPCLERGSGTHGTSNAVHKAGIEESVCLSIFRAEKALSTDSFEKEEAFYEATSVAA